MEEFSKKACIDIVDVVTAPIEKPFNADYVICVGGDREETQRSIVNRFYLDNGDIADSVAEDVEGVDHLRLEGDAPVSLAAPIDVTESPKAFTTGEGADTVELGLNGVAAIEPQWDAAVRVDLGGGPAQDRVTLEVDVPLDELSISSGIVPGLSLGDLDQAFLIRNGEGALVADIRGAEMIALVGNDASRDKDIAANMASGAVEVWLSDVQENGPNTTPVKQEIQTLSH